MEEGSSQSAAYDTSREKIGMVYAKALVGMAEKKGITDNLLEELQSLLVDVLEHFPKLAAALASPRIAYEAKVRMLDNIFKDRMSYDMLVFLKVLARHQRLDCLRAVYRAARKYVNELRGRVEVKVTTATPLDDHMRSQLQARVEQMVGRQVELDTHVDPELLGGVVLTIGDTVYDTSLANRLRQLEGGAVARTLLNVRESMDRFTLAE